MNYNNKVHALLIRRASREYIIRSYLLLCIGSLRDIRQLKKTEE